MNDVVKQAMEKVASQCLYKEAQGLEDLWNGITEKGSELKAKITNYWDSLDENERATIIGLGALGIPLGAFIGPTLTGRSANPAVKGLVTAGTTLGTGLLGLGLGVGAVEGWDYVEPRMHAWLGNVEKVSEKIQELEERKANLGNQGYPEPVYNRKLEDINEALEYLNAYKADKTPSNS